MLGFCCHRAKPSPAKPINGLVSRQMTEPTQINHLFKQTPQFILFFHISIQLYMRNHIEVTNYFLKSIEVTNYEK